jgi:hypothetical protein
MEQLAKIFSPQNRIETAMAVPTPRVLEPITTTTTTVTILQGWLYQQQQQQQQHQIE